MSMAAERVVGVWRGGERVDALDPADRGLVYGDGLFETMRAHDGALPWWPRHRARLLAGARRLGLPFPADGVLDAALGEALAASPDGVVKLIVTRGAGARGYAPTREVEPTLIVSSSAAPVTTPDALAVDVLALRLAGRARSRRARPR